MERVQGRTVLITGASRGLGSTLACAFARAGAGKLILVAGEGGKQELQQVGGAPAVQGGKGSAPPPRRQPLAR